ncbi:MAG: hydrogenase maturation protease [Spirochaetes bacterium]|nr:hydrogenase maturation protease [Spirochaetota bacterium]
MDILSHIRDVVSEKACVVGVGNYYRRDDAVGLYIAQQLKEQADPERCVVINAEDVIESYVFSIADSDCKNVILVDAVSADGEPGSVLFGRLDEFEDFQYGVTTHKLAFGLCGRILEDRGKRTYLLGIVPQDIDFGQGLTEAVEKSAAIIKEHIIESLKYRKESLHEH